MKLTGYSGFVGSIHISAPYSSCGLVFVHEEDGWERTHFDLLSGGLNDERIIRCECGNPAEQLDHFYPYYNDYTLCKKCAIGSK